MEKARKVRAWRRKGVPDEHVIRRILPKFDDLVLAVVDIDLGPNSGPVDGDGHESLFFVAIDVLLQGVSLVRGRRVSSWLAVAPPVPVRDVNR